MPRQPTWKGSTAVTEAPESPSYEESESGGVWKLTFHGPYAACKAAKPARLSTVAGYTGYLVDKITLARSPGGKGVLIITLANSPTPGGSSESQDPIYEIEWMAIQKKLETHPIYTGGSKNLTDDDRDKIEEFRNASTFAARATAYNALSTNAKHFADKLRKGIDSYNEYAPVARATTTHGSKPATGGCGSQGSPPGGTAIAGYTYVKTADRAIRRGRAWERVQEWTGAKSLDTDLYP